jgi:hypothetical protein
MRIRQFIPECGLLDPDGGGYSIALMTSSPRTAYCADVTCMEREAAADGESIGITLGGGGWGGWRWLVELD